MNRDLPGSNHLILSRISFVLILFTAAYWIIGQFVDFYATGFTGALFEILWLPMIGILFLVPVVSAVFWVKGRFGFQSLFLYTAIIGIATIMFVFVYG